MFGKLAHISRFRFKLCFQNIQHLQIPVVHNSRCISTSKTVQQQVVCNPPPSDSSDKDVENYRKTIAPWLKIGEYKIGLLSHLSTFEILRALLVLQMCSVDIVVDKSVQVEWTAF